MYMFILHFKIKLFLSFLYFQNKIHISYYCDFYSGLIQKIISPCMLKNTNFACFFCLFYACTNTTPPIQFYLDVGGFGAIKSHAFFCCMILCDLILKKLWLYNIVIQKYLIFYFFSGT